MERSIPDVEWGGTKMGHAKLCIGLQCFVLLPYDTFSSIESTNHRIISMRLSQYLTWLYMPRIDTLLAPTSRFSIAFTGYGVGFDHLHHKWCQERGVWWLPVNVNSLNCVRLLTSFTRHVRTMLIAKNVSPLYLLYDYKLLIKLILKSCVIGEEMT